MGRPLGITGRGLRLAISRPGTASVAIPPAPSPPHLVTEAGDAIVTSDSDTIATESA
jgi:hypothetical protein